MEQEIDLRPYVQAVVRQRYMVLIVMALAVVAAIIVSMTLPRPAMARGEVLIIAQTPQVSIDGRFTERDATQFTSPSTQRQALISLASSPQLEAMVVERLGLSSYQTGTLLSQIEIASTTDLLEVRAQGATTAEAQRLAEAWVGAYEELVAELFSGSGNQIMQVEAELSEARQRFEQTQVALDTFYASGDLIRATSEVTRLTGLVFGDVEAQVSLYTEHLARIQQLSQILNDARSLQAQYEAGAQTDLSANLAALAVRARLAGVEQLPVQLSFANAESFAQAETAGADLARFVAVLETDRERMVAQATALAADLATGNTTVVGLNSELRRAYEADLAAARAARERAHGTELRLLQERNQALNTIEVLQNRADELRIEQPLGRVQLRVVGVTAAPPVGLAFTLVRNSIIAAMLGLSLGVLLSLALELGRRLTGSKVQRDSGAPPAGEAASRLPSSD